MKSIAIFLCSLCLASYGLVRADDAELASNSCLQKTGVTLDDIPSLLRDQSAEGIRRRGCLEHCYLEKMGLMTGNSINMENIDSQIERTLENSDKETVRAHMHQCAADAVDDDECMIAQKFVKCGFEHLQLGVQHLFQAFKL